MFEKTLFTLLFATTSTLCWADIYKYVDENGNVTFTTMPVIGAVRIMYEPAVASRPNQKSYAPATKKKKMRADQIKRVEVIETRRIIIERE